jgi:hypothetical protein
MLTKGIPFSSKYFVFPFYLNTNLAFDSVQGSIFPYKQFFPWEFCSPFFLELSCCIIVLLLCAYLRLGLSFLALGKDPLKNMDTSSMQFALEGSELQLENKGGEDGRARP